MLIEAYQMDALLLKTWNHSAYNNVYLCPFELKPCWVLFLQYCLHLRERHYWGYFSGQHIWESKREIQSEMDIDIILDCDTFNPYLNSSTSFSLRPERYSMWCIQFVEAALKTGHQTNFLFHKRYNCSPDLIVGLVVLFSQCFDIKETLSDIRFENSSCFTVTIFVESSKISLKSKMITQQQKHCVRKKVSLSVNMSMFHIADWLSVLLMFA